MKEVFKFKGIVKQEDDEQWYLIDEKQESHNAGDSLTGIDILSTFWTEDGDEVEIVIKRKEKK